jgi:integrase
MATIRKRGDKWQVQIRRTGSRAVSKSFHIRKDAGAWARQMEVQADRSELPSDPKALQRVTLGELIQRYSDTVSVSKRTGWKERIMLRAMSRHPICLKRLSELRTEDFARYRDERLQVIKASSLRRELTPIRNLFEVARHEWGLPLRENPLANLSLDARDDKRERRLRPGELERLLQAANSSRNRYLGPIIRLAVETGMRRGEILAIRRSDIDVDRRCLLIPQTKNGHSRTIPLTTSTTALLEPFRSEDRLFPLTANAFRLAWERLRRRAGLVDLHFHDLRHEAISLFFEQGLTAPEVALISGHRDMRMLFRYTHPVREQILAKLDRANASLR